MKFRSLFAPLLFSLTMVVPCALQAEDAVVADSSTLAVTLDSFLERYFKANGGKDKILLMRSIRAEAALTLADGRKGNLVYVYQQPGYMRSVWFGPAGVTLRRGNNGKQSWELVSMPDGTIKGRMTNDMPGQMFEWTIANPESCGATLEFLPVERAERAEYYRIKAKYADGRIKNYWLDTATLAEVKVEETLADGKVKTFLIDKSIRYDGIWFPALQRELDQDGRELNRIELLDVQMNIGLLPCFFDPPEDLAKAIAEQASAQ